jgi:hypothetical protein
VCQECERLEREVRQAAIALSRAENALSTCHPPISIEEWTKRKADVRQAQQNRESAEAQLKRHLLFEESLNETADRSPIVQ